MSNRSTCSNCRKKKIRCDGNVPQCGQCSRRRWPNGPACDYSPPEAISQGDLLRKGDACLPCRRKKKKCTGDRPTCKACVGAGRGEQCSYNLRRARPGAGHSSKQYNHSVTRFRANEPNAPVASSVRSATLLEEEFDYQTTVAPSTAKMPTIDDVYAVSRRPSQRGLCFDSLWRSTSDPSTSSAVYSPTNDGVSKTCSMLQSPPTATTPMRVYGKQPPTPPSMKAIDNSLPDSFLRPPGPPYKSLFHLPYASELRALFFAHGVKMSIRMTQDKLDAIARADISGFIIHPIFIHIAHLIGAIFYHHDQAVNIEQDSEANDLQVVMSILSQPNALPPVASIQALALLAYYHYYKRDLSSAWDRMRTAVDLVLSHDMHITIPTSDAFTEAYPVRHRGGPLAAVDGIDEERSVLVQVLYWDRGAETLLGIPFGSTPHLVTEFQAWTALDPSPQLSNPVVTRTMCAWLLYETRAFIQQWGQPEALGLTHPSPLWYETCLDLTHRIERQLIHVQHSTMRASLVFEDRLSTVAYKGFAIVCLTALTNMYTVLAQVHEGPDSKRRLLDTVEHVVSISESFTDEEYDYMDAPLHMCWNTVREVLLQQEQLQSASVQFVGEGERHTGGLLSMVSTLRQCMCKLERTASWVPTISVAI